MTADPVARFVSTAWLADNLGAPDLAILDGSFFLPDEKRDAEAEYRAGHIPGAVFFDIDAIADHSTHLPHMLPDAAAFARAMTALGIADTMRVVVYDSLGLRGAARVWWTLRTFGVTGATVLDGGLPKWKTEGRPLETGTVRRPPRPFVPRFDAAAVADAARVKRAAETKTAQVVDARPGARFRGEAPEPRAGLRPGHIPGSLSVPSSEVTENGRLKSRDDLATVFAKAGVALDRPIITTCGSGVTAAILLLALDSLGKTDVTLYDGSWSEWGGRPDLPVATT